MKKETKAWQDLVTGSISGAADVLATHPLWTIKTLSQNNMTSPQIFKLVKSNPLILYNGVAANALTMLPLTTIRIALSSAFEKAFDSKSPYLELMSSFTAGSISSIFSAPTELGRTVKLKSAVFSKSNLSLNFKTENTYNIIKDIYNTEGIKKAFTGYMSVASRDGIYTAAFFTGAPLLKEITEPYFNNKVAQTLFSYSAASIFASFINHPFDTIKTVQHSLFAENWQLNTTHQYDPISVCKKIYQKEGVSGFFKGYLPRGNRFLIGLIIKASIIEKMTEYWDSYNSFKGSSSNSKSSGIDFLDTPPISNNHNESSEVDISGDNNNDDC